MAKISKEEQARKEGMSYAVRFLDQGHTLDELRADIQMRGAYNIPLRISKAEHDEYMMRATAAIVEGFMLMSVMVLRTEFKFGASRIERFKRVYEERAKDLTDGLYGWDDLKWLIDKELGLKEETA